MRYQMLPMEMEMEMEMGVDMSNGDGSTTNLSICVVFRPRHPQSLVAATQSLV